MNLLFLIVQTASLNSVQLTLLIGRNNGVLKNELKPYTVYFFPITKKINQFLSFDD